MAYDKPLKIQWTEINGRTVPLVLPQFWDEEQEDWVVSSEQNRLPVDAQLTGSNVEVEVEKPINAEVVEENRNFPFDIDTADADECNLWVSSDQPYLILVYPRTGLGDYPIAEKLAEGEAIQVGRQRRHKIGKEFFPAHSILCSFLNRGTEPATVSIYIATSKRV